MSRSRRRDLTFAVVVCALATTTAPAIARADAPTTAAGAYSPYETESIRAAAKLLGTSLDDAPDGKVIESIDTVRLDPIEERDPAPLFLDAVHTTTKRDVILHEVLQRPGERWRQELVDETARNLRTFDDLSLVLCVAMRGSTSDRVRLVVITKDVWSLYPDFDFSITSGGLENLTLEPKETNLAGRQATLLARFVLEPASVTLGGSFVAPRFDGRWLTLTTDANVIVNRDRGTAEGSYGAATIARPLYSTQTEWAWATAFTWDDRIARRYENAHVALYEGSLPWEWRARKVKEELSLTRSFGWRTKNDVTIGADLARDVYRVEAPSSPLASAFTQENVPRGEARVGPFVEWHGFRNDFLRTVDVETLGLQEDFRLGPEADVRAYPVLAELGSSRSFVGARVAAAETVQLGDGFARALVDTTTEAEEARISDASILGELRIVSPRTALGRLVFDVSGQNRWRNYLNRTSVLGGEDRLRGWPTRYFVGKDVVASNLELRTRAIEVAACQLGAAAFYDAGGAFQPFARHAIVHSAGAGLRVVLPQIERLVIRADVGFPMEAGGLPADVSPVSFFIGFGQAFRSSLTPAPFGP